MNAATAAPEPTPMHKEEVVKDDGRLLYFYTFPPEGTPAPTPAPEDADV